MHPDLALVLYQQRERELEATLRRRLLRTCCAALGAGRRSRWSTLVRQVTALVGPGRTTSRAAACCA